MSQPVAVKRRRRWIGLLLVLAVLLIAAGIISALILNQRISTAPEPKASTNQPSATTSTLARTAEHAEHRRCA